MCLFLNSLPRSFALFCLTVFSILFSFKLPFSFHSCMHYYHLTYSCISSIIPFGFFPLFLSLKLLFQLTITFLLNFYLPVPSILFPNFSSLLPCFYPSAFLCIPLTVCSSLFFIYHFSLFLTLVLAISSHPSSYSLTLLYSQNLPSPPSLCTPPPGEPGRATTLGFPCRAL